MTKLSLEEAGMNRPDDLRKNAENCVALAEIADSGPKTRRYARMATAGNCLADSKKLRYAECESALFRQQGSHGHVRYALHGRQHDGRNAGLDPRSLR